MFSFWTVYRLKKIWHPCPKPLKPVLQKYKHSAGNSKSHFFQIRRTQLMTFGTIFITTVCCVRVDSIVLQNTEAKWSIGHTYDSQVQTLVAKLVNYASQQRAEGELSCFGDE